MSVKRVGSVKYLEFFLLLKTTEDVDSLIPYSCHFPPPEIILLTGATLIEAIL